jgi:hypothetical protein
VSIDRPLGGWPTIDLPDDFGDSTSWQRARDEESTVEPINRAEWMVRVGDGDRHRVVFGTRSGTPVGECDCKGYTHHGWCAHLAAMLLAYGRSSPPASTRRTRCCGGSIGEVVRHERSRWKRYRPFGRLPPLKRRGVLG